MYVCKLSKLTNIKIYPNILQLGYIEIGHYIILSTDEKCKAVTQLKAETPKALPLRYVTKLE